MCKGSARCEGAWLGELPFGAGGQHGLWPHSSGGGSGSGWGRLRDASSWYECWSWGMRQGATANVLRTDRRSTWDYALHGGTRICRGSPCISHRPAIGL